MRFGFAEGVKAGWLYLYPPLEASPLPAFFYSDDMRSLLIVCRPSKVFCCVHFLSFGAHSPHTSLILFCVADLYTHTLRASTVPSPSCEAPPEQGHKVLEAGTYYPYN